ncbi:extracellular calcium-sensing receptor-like [Ambystoma mexicanum]|uniref:extracellular calcium-sensing receptor-like n=1 Tax=Ambystoma mexicanum TaxID=8296 RepID=UPI0037E91975
MSQKHAGKQPLHPKAMLYLALVFFRPTPTAPTVDPACQHQRPELVGLSGDGHIVLGGVFTVHHDRQYHETNFREKPAPITCQRFGFQNYQWLQAIVFAIEEINKNPNILPNVTLGFWIYDSCTIIQRALEGTLQILTGKGVPIPNYRCKGNVPLAGVIGEAVSSCSITMARLLGLYRYPQISYVSSSPILSDRLQFPSFFRTIPSDDFQSRGLAQLLIHFGWTWIGLLADDDDYGQQGIQLLKHELTSAGACVAFSENIMLSRADRNAFRIIPVIKGSTANVIVIFSSEAGLTPLMEEMVRQNVTGKTWIASEAWSTSSLLSMERYWDILAGTIGFAIHSGEMPGFEAHLTSINPSKYPNDDFTLRFWEEAFGCKWNDLQNGLDVSHNGTILCTGVEQIGTLRTSYNDVTNLRATYNVYNAVYAIAMALHDLNFCRGGHDPFQHGVCSDVMDFQPWQLLQYVKKVRLPNGGEDFFFNENGDVAAKYDIVNWQKNSEGTLRHVTVGRYDSSVPQEQALTIHISTIQWKLPSQLVPLSVCSPSCGSGYRQAASEGGPICCFLCVFCPTGEISNKTDSVECTKCPWNQWPNARQNRCILKTVEFLSYEEPLGTTLAVASNLGSLLPVAVMGLYIRYRKTPIVKASNSNLSYLLLTSLTLCFLCSLVFIGVPTPGKCLLRQAVFGIIFALCVSCILAKTIMVVIAFKATKPNSNLRRWAGPQLSYVVIIICTLIQILVCTFWLVLSPPFPEHNIHSQAGKIIVECNEGSPFAFWCMLGYLGLLATISFIVAFMARKLPDSFNEAKYITFSMLAFLSVWISFIPAYLSTRGKYMVAMEIFAILSSSSALVCCIFFPKCYIIVMKPEINSKKYLLGRGAKYNNKANIT